MLSACGPADAPPESEDLNWGSELNVVRSDPAFSALLSRFALLSESSVRTCSGDGIDNALPHFALSLENQTTVGDASRRIRTIMLRSGWISTTDHLALAVPMAESYGEWTKDLDGITGLVGLDVTADRIHVEGSIANTEVCSELTG